ncbi:MAG TPA: hypothetical protein VLZ50_07815 [Terracidiphilus sp.]|nr:hypothetical protein [Terracidiphilus sp.]
MDASYGSNRTEPGFARAKYEQFVEDRHALKGHGFIRAAIAAFKKDEGFSP